MDACIFSRARRRPISDLPPTISLGSRARERSVAAEFGKKWYVERESLLSYFKVLEEFFRSTSLASEVHERTSAERIAHSMHTRGRHTMRDWSPPNEASKPRSASPFFPLASLALAVILATAVAYAAFNPMGASTIVSRAQSQFAAASADTSIFDRAAQFLFRAVCPIFRSCDLNDVRIADATGANQNIIATPLPRQAATTASTSSSQTASTSFAPASSTSTAAGNPPVVQRVVERIVERALPTYTIASPPAGGGITEAILNDRLDQLDNKLSSRIFSLSASLTSVPNSLPASGGVTNNVALSQRIDNLDGTHIARAVITDATISGGNVTATAFSGLLGVGSGGTGTSSAPSYGKMLVGNSAGGYDLLATSSLGISAGDVPGGSDTYVLFNNGDVFGGVSSFTFGSSTGLLTVPFAFTTAVTISGTASTSLFFANGLSNCNSNNNLTWLDGTFGCEPDDTSAGSANPFAWEQNYATVNAATSSIFWAKSGVNASSTSHFANASTTLQTIGTQWFTSLSNSGIGVDANGKIYAAATTTFSTGLSYANGAVTCDTASHTVLGCLSTADWDTFSAKQNVLAFTYPLQNNTNTISLLFGTSTANSWTHQIFSSLFATNASTTNATTTNLYITSLSNSGLGVDANGKVYAAATSTLSTISGSLNLGTQVTGTLALSSIAQVGANSVLANATGGSAAPTAISTTTLFAGINGQVLTFANGAWTGVGTTSLTNGTGITTSYADGIWTIANTGALFGYPFTSQSYASQPTSATTSTLWLTGAPLSLAASSSVLTYASTTAITASNIWVTPLAIPAGSFIAVDAEGKIIATSTPAVGGGGTVTNVSGANGISGSVSSNGSLSLISYLATSSNEIAGNLSYWTTTNGNPAKLGTVATTSLTASGVLSLSQPISVIGDSASALTLTGGSNGQVLGWLGGAPAWAATTTFSTGLTYSGGAVTCDTASASVLGCLSSADWNTFNNKQAAGNYITALTGDVTASGPGSASVSFALGNTHWWTAQQNFGNASTSQFTATSSVWLTSLGTPAGTFLAVDPNGLVIATSTPAVGGSGTVTNIATTYPITGGPITTTGTLSLAFGTSTTNTWTHQIFSSLFATNASTTNATTTNLYITSLSNSGLGVDANGKVYAAATSTLSTISGSLNLGTQVTGTLALSSIAQIGANSVLVNNTSALGNVTSIGTSTFFGTGTGGQVLAWNSGVPQWVATTTLSNGTGITTTYSAATNQWTITNTGATFAFPFTTSSTFGTTSSATSSSIQTVGVFFASSTVAASQFPFASSTAITISGTASTSFFFANGLTNCSSNNNLTWVNGTFGCEPDDTATGEAPAFAWESNYAAVNAATSSVLWAKFGINASSTSHFANASTSQFTVGAQWFPSLSNSGLGVDANGKVYAAATSTLANISGTLALTQLANQNANTVLANATAGSAAPTAIATSSFFGTGAGGQVLAWNSGVPQWVATTTFSTGLTYANGAVVCDTASGSALGCLTGTDWDTFNNKQVAGNYITALTGDVTASGPGSASVSFALGNTHWWTAQQNFGNASTSQFSATSSVWFTSLGTPAGTFLAVDPNGLLIATSTPAVGGSGTVTNIATTYPITGGPITTTGTLSLAFGTTTTNTWTHQIFSSLFALSASSTNATTTNLHITSLASSGLGVDANGKVYAAATSTLANIAGVLAVPSGGTGTTTVPSGQVLYGGGAGVYQSVATGTISAGPGISLDSNSRYVLGGPLTITNTGALFAFPFTTSSTYGTTSAATSSSIQTAGVFFASSTAAASQFPFASSTALSAGTLCLSTDCRTSWPTAGGTDDPFTHETWWGQANVSATTSALHLTGSPFSLFASSTAVFELASSTAASTTRLTTGTQWFASLANSGLGVDANGKVYAAATSTLATISGTLALTQLANQNANTVLVNNTAGAAAPTAIATSSFFGQGLGGTVLSWSGGVPQWVATTTLTNGSGITTTYSAASNQWTITNTGATFAFPFTTSSTYGTTSSATSSSIQTAGVFFASSTAAASVFPYASTTAFTASGSGYFATDAGASVGIGTTSPWALLSINPNGITGPSFVIGSSTATSFLVTNAGKVGIGTASPAYALDVNGDVNVASGKCFRVNGVCIGYVTKLAAIYATSSVGTTTVAFGNGGPSFSGGTLTLPASTTQMVVEMWGAGGGGADSATYAGAGGGGGGYFQKLITTPSGTYSFTVGKGGTGCTGDDCTGKTGGLSYFNGIATSTGGPGAVGGGAVAIGGVGQGGDVNLSGGGSKAGDVNSNQCGGSAPRGGAGGCGDSANGAAFGGGGSGHGGNGGTGGVVITIYATSTPTAPGNDYAEMFPVSNPGITAGDIVAVDAGVPVSMKFAAAGESAPLAGIIATNPGQLLGDKEAVGSRPVALAGRVPTKVNLEGGPISIGDRVAPSSVPGVGRKAGPFDNSVGIALETFSGGAGGSSQGSVTVFLDLQRGINIDEIGMTLLGTSATSTPGTPFDFVDNLLSAIASRITAPAATSTSATSTTATSTAATSTPSIADSFISAIFSRIAQWFADAANGITNLFADTFHARKQICIKKSDGADACVTGDQLAAVLSATNQTLQSEVPPPTPASAEPPPTDTATSTDSTSSPQAAATSSPPTSDPSTSPEPTETATTPPAVIEPTQPALEQIVDNSPPLAPEQETEPEAGAPSALDAADSTETAQ